MDDDRKTETDAAKQPQKDPAKSKVDPPPAGGPNAPAAGPLDKDGVTSNDNRKGGYGAG